MKRTAKAIVLLAGLGGGCATPDGSGVAPGASPFGRATAGKEIPGVVGPTGEPVQPGVVAAGQMPGDGPARVVTADVNGRTPAGGVKQTGGFRLLGGRQSAYVGGVAGGCADGSCGTGGGGMPMGGMGGGSAYGPTNGHLGAILAATASCRRPAWGLPVPWPPREPSAPRAAGTGRCT